MAQITRYCIVMYIELYDVFDSNDTLFKEYFYNQSTSLEEENCSKMRLLFQ